MLKSGWGVGQAKRHDIVLEMAISGAKSSLPFVTRADLNQVIGIVQVNLGKYLSMGQLVQQAS